MPNGNSSNPFDTVPTDPNATQGGPLRAVNDFGNALFAPPSSTARGRLNRAGYDPVAASQPWSQGNGWQGRLMAGAQGASGMAANPYNAQYANQARGGQMALLEQMRAAAAGPSLAGMQGQRAMGQNGQQALQQAAMGGGRQAMLSAGNAAGGLAGDVSQARLAENMRAQAGVGGLAGDIRGADQKSALAGANSGLDAQQMQDSMRQFYLGLGANSSLDDMNYQLDQQKINQRVLQNATQETNKAYGDVGNFLASLVGMAAKGG